MLVCIVMPGLGLLMSSSGLGRAQPSQSGETADRALWLLLITTTSSPLLSSLCYTQSCWSSDVRLGLSSRTVRTGGDYVVRSDRHQTVWCYVRVLPVLAVLSVAR